MKYKNIKNETIKSSNPYKSLDSPKINSTNSKNELNF